MIGQFPKNIKVFLFVFSMVNLVNTLMTNLLARQQELGILQSVGMTGKQVSRMLIAECLWYAGVTVFLSVGIGGILGWIFDYVIECQQQINTAGHHL